MSRTRRKSKCDALVAGATQDAHPKLAGLALEQVGRVDAQHRGDALERGQRQVLAAALKTLHVPRRDPQRNGHDLLGHAALSA